jgi:signal transduction histidine kinase
MNIRTKLTLRFILIAAITTLLACVFIYIFSEDYREELFFTRLHNKANNTAKLLIEVDEVDLALLRKIEENNPMSLPGEVIKVYNLHDSLVYSSDEHSSLEINTALLEQIRHDGEIHFTHGEYEGLGYVFEGKSNGFIVVSAAIDIFGFKKLANLKYILISVFCCSIVILSISGWFFAGKALEPIGKVVDQVSEISVTSLDVRVDEGNGKDEIARLAHTFNNMLSRLETSFITQKNFISNASHELRTPLTSITGQLEVLLLNPRSAEEYRNVINSVLEDIRTLNNLCNRLLLLAQANSDEREKRMTPLRIDELIWQAKEDLVKRNPTYEINIDLDENLDDERKLTIKGDEQLVKTAITNVMENGCKYSKDQTTNVFILASGFGISVIFKDSGIGILKEDMANIFEPFFRGSNTQLIKGHGIGLSMVKGIVKIHNGTVNLESEFGMGTTVTVELPLAGIF